MKKNLILLSFALLPFAAFAQGEMDALNMGETDILGTARFMSMGGAFGALGGDASAIGVNPAGLGIYRKTEISITPSVMVNRTSAAAPSGTIDDHVATFNVNNFATILNFKGNNKALKTSSFGFVYNRKTNFRRNMNALYAGSESSLSDYMALRTNQLNIAKSELSKEGSAFSGDIPMICDLGWQGYMIDATDDSDDCTTYKSFLKSDELTTSNTWNTEKGGINQFDFSYGANINDMFFVGASLGVYSLNYRLDSYYTENYEEGGYFNLSNRLKTSGAGVDFKLGAIVAPVDFLRIGFAFHTPTWYFLQDKASFAAEYDTGTDRTGTISTVSSITDYDYKTPYSIVASLGFVIGKKALISADYEMSDYSKMEFDNASGGDNFNASNAYWTENQLISSDFRKKHTVRLGAEYRVTDNFSVRLGYSISTSPVKSALEDDTTDSGERANVIYTAGATPAYSIPQKNSYYSAGFGYSKDFFFIDFAYALNLQNENYYMFFDQSGKTEPIDLKTKRHYAVCTIGFKF